MRINTNVTALNAFRNLSRTESAISKSMEKLSSGFRINHASDDAAGLGIANGMAANIRSSQQASRNAEQATSVLQIMEGSATQVQNILERMKELGAQAASDNTDNAGRTTINSEFQTLSQELDRIVSTTKFQGATLLDGTFGSKSTANGAIDATGSTFIDTTNVASGTVSNASTLKTINGDITASVVKTGNTLGAASATGATASAATQSTIDTIDATSLDVSATQVASTTDFTPDATVTDLTVADGVAAGAYTVQVAANGTTPANADVTITDGTTTYTASNFDPSAGGTLVADDGSGNTFTFTIASGASLADLQTSLGTAASPKTINVTQNYNVTLSGDTTIGTSAAQTISDDGTADGSATFSEYGISLTVTSGNVAGLDGSTIALTEKDALKLDGTDTSGNAVTQQVDLNSDPASQSLDFSSKFGIKLDLSAAATTAALKTLITGGNNVIAQGASKQAQFLVSSSGSYTDKDLVSLDSVDLRAATLGVDTASVDLTTAAGAQAALTVFDSAIDTVSSAFASIGAAQNRFDYALQNVNTTVQNLSAAESTIRDVDMAQEMTTFSKNQVLQQAGTAMLAQANQLGQGVLQLLRG